MSSIDVSSAVAPENHAHTIQMAEINAGVSSSEGPQNQNNTAVRLNLPSLHLLSGRNRALYYSRCITLYEAALKGDWKKAQPLVKTNRSMLLAAITEGYETALHVATGARQVAFVRNIIDWMEPDDLTLQDRNGNTAFCIAVAVGSKEIVKVLLKKNSNLLGSRGSEMKLLSIAVLYGQKDMAKYIYDRSKTFLTQDERTSIFFESIKSDLYDIALKLLEGRPELAVTRNVDGDTALHLLARKPSNVFLKERKFTRNWQAEISLLKCLWNEAIENENVDIKELIASPSNLLFDAAKWGNFEFLAELIRSYPSLVHELDENKQTIFHIAILHCHTSIFNLIYKIGAFNQKLIANYVDVEKNTMLHLAAKSASSSAVGFQNAVLQLQRKLILFEEVEMIMHPSLKETKNAEGLTPIELFAKEHTSLLKRSEKLVKDVATSGMVVAALIAAIVFPAAITFLDDKTEFGLIRDPATRILAISNALALCLSSLSILIFLSIFTARYSFADFRKILPLKLTIGLHALLASVAAMIVCYCSTNFLLFWQSNFLPIVITVILTTVFVSVSDSEFFPLARDVILSTLLHKFQRRRF